MNMSWWTTFTALPVTVVPLSLDTLNEAAIPNMARNICPLLLWMHLLLPLAKGHLSSVATVSWQIGWSYYGGTIYVKILICVNSSLKILEIICNGFVSNKILLFFRHWCLTLALKFMCGRANTYHLPSVRRRWSLHTSCGTLATITVDVISTHSAHCMVGSRIYVVVVE